MKKQDEYIVKRYENSGLRTLDQCYGKCSAKKVEAYNECLKKMQQVNGHNFKIITYNINVFTCGWLSEDESKLYVETKSKSIIMEL